MDRLTIPDVKLDEHTTRRTMIDGEAVRERAMEIYWRLKDYEDTGLTPAEVLSISGEWCAMMSVLNSIGSYDRLHALAKADKDGRVVVLDPVAKDLPPDLYDLIMKQVTEIINRAGSCFNQAKVEAGMAIKASQYQQTTMVQIIDEGKITVNDKVCCNCGNCERRPERGSIETYCAIDNHYIGYVECFTRKCKHWKRETKWDGMEGERNES